MSEKNKNINWNEKIQNYKEKTEKNPRKFKKPTINPRKQALVDSFFNDTQSKMQQFYSKPENSEINFNKIKNLISKTLSLDLNVYRDQFIKRRIYFRIVRLGLNSFVEYYNYLISHSEEFNAFAESFTIHTTEFFRDIVPFRYLEEVLLPKIDKSIGKHRNNSIKILSAPCSTGEEPYSLAIIASFLKKKHRIIHNVEIYAYDLDQKTIEFAKRGNYPSDALKNMKSETIPRNFIELNDGSYQIKPHIQQLVHFEVRDLLKPLPNIEFDLVVCRNFLIYIDKIAQKKVLDNILSHLKPNGYLMLGKTEGFPLLNAKLFEYENLREHIYKYTPSEVRRLSPNS